jgi:hypothetical protein
MDIFGSNFVDAGAGNGVPMTCSIAVGAGNATGYELPENDAHRFIFAALMSRLEQTMFPPGYSVGRVLWKPQDINEVPLYLLYLLCCFHCLPNVQFPNLFDKTVGANELESGEWSLGHSIKTAMYGSGAKHIAWVFHRD